MASRRCVSISGSSYLLRWGSSAGHRGRQQDTQLQFTTKLGIFSVRHRRLSARRETLQFESEPVDEGGMTATSPPGSKPCRARAAGPAVSGLRLDPWRFSSPPLPTAEAARLIGGAI